MTLTSMRTIACAVTIGACLFVSGCSTNVSRYQLPGTDLSNVRAVKIVPPEDERQAEELRALIESELKERGIEIADEADSTAPKEGTFVFDYAVDWHWDLTWYLLELRVAIYDPADDTLVAQAQSQQTSLVRKSIDIVVDRAMASLFDESEIPAGGQ